MSDRPDNTPQRDLYDYYEAGDGQVSQPRQQEVVPNRMYEDAYAQRGRDVRCGTPNPGDQVIRQGENTIIIKNDVHVECNCKGAMNYDYRQPNGRMYDYREYYQRQCYQPNYYDYGYRQPPAQYHHAQNYGYDYGQYYQDSYRRQNPQYSRDDVYGGPGGYRSSRERYNGGYENYGNGGNYYGNRGGCFGNGGYDGGYSQGGASDWDRAGQVFDFALRGFDTWAGYDIARRYARNDGRRGGGYDNGYGHQQQGYGDRRNYRHAWQR